VNRHLLTSRLRRGPSRRQDAFTLCFSFFLNGISDTPVQ
jgi:hypothetical protein